MGWLKKIVLGIVSFFVLLVAIGAILGPPPDEIKEKPVTPTTTVKPSVDLGTTNFVPGIKNSKAYNCPN